MQRLALRWRAKSVPIGFVPTMGCLHAGHLSLVTKARRLVGKNGKVVVSVYVNPTQFGPREDFGNYPRNPRRDATLCRRSGVDIFFQPTDRQMYTQDASGPDSTVVLEDRLACSLEGISRPTHFRGVTTVVAKLFNIVLPDVAVFGTKDYQQAAVIGRMVRDLHFPVRLAVGRTQREPDGLAMSSRNQYLNPQERRDAVVLWEAGQMARRRVRERSRGGSARRLISDLTALVESRATARVDYVALVDPRTLEPVLKVTRGTHLVLAVWIGRTRLIDNFRL